MFMPVKLKIIRLVDDHRVTNSENLFRKSTIVIIPNQIYTYRSLFYEKYLLNLVTIKAKTNEIISICGGQLIIEYVVSSQV